MKLISTILFLTALKYCGYGQTDSMRILESAKLLLISEIGLVDGIESAKKEIDSTFKVKFLESSGFDSTVHFILLSKRPENSNWHDSVFMNNNVYGSCEYVLCYYEKLRMFYKLKGFIDNNVFLFFQHLSYLSKGYPFSTVILRGNRKILEFDLKYSIINIPHIDILCLYDYWKSYSKGKITNSDCLKPCWVRDLHFMNIPDKISYPKGNKKPL